MTDTISIFFTVENQIDAILTILGLISFRKYLEGTLRYVQTEVISNYWNHFWRHF